MENQGKKESQNESSEAFAFIALVGIIAIILSLIF
jgi:hypothetical protein